MTTLIETVAQAIDPDAWGADQPIPTRDATVTFHARRQASVAKARAALQALHDAGPTKRMLQAVSWREEYAPDAGDFRMMIAAELEEGKADA